MTEVFQSAGKVTLLINTNGSDASVKDALMQAIRFRTETAVVLSGTPDQSIAEACQSNGIKLVLINRADEIENALHILPDNDSVGEIALNALLNAGCKTIALANSDTQTASILARERSFIKAAQARGIAVRRCTSGLTTYESGLEIGTDLFSRGTRPDGVFCTTDLIACGVMDVARQRFGLQIPQDLSVIGFDDIAQAGWEAYQLTTFRQPIEKISQACLDWSLENGEEGGKIIIPVRLVLRESLRRPAS
jgi:DNA-binding LacI/PurR family transcriptional regulator